jgi:hypothetical protein
MNNTIEKLQTIAKNSIDPLSLLEDAIINVEEGGCVMLKSYILSYRPLSAIRDLEENKNE